MSDETTILDSQYLDNTSSNNRASTNPQHQNSTRHQSRYRKKNKMGWGENTANTAKCAVYSAGIDMADQVMGAPSAEVPTLPMPEDKTIHQESYDHQGLPPIQKDDIAATATGVRVAQIDDNASFSQAFAGARAQVGPGGIFEWHGRVYATYYKDEWDNLSAAERQKFQASIEHDDVTTDDSIVQTHNDIAHNSSQPLYHEAYQESQSDIHQQTQNNDNDYPQVGDDNEVHVLDVAQTDLNEDGIVMHAPIEGDMNLVYNDVPDYMNVTDIDNLLV